MTVILFIELSEHKLASNSHFEKFFCGCGVEGMVVATTNCIPPCNLLKWNTYLKFEDFCKTYLKMYVFGAIMQYSLSYYLYLIYCLS